MFGYPVLRSKPQRWIPELRFGYPPLRHFSKSFWEKLGICLESLGGSQRQLCIKTRPLVSVMIFGPVEFPRTPISLASAHRAPRRCHLLDNLVHPLGMSALKGYMCQSRAEHRHMQVDRQSSWRCKHHCTHKNITNLTPKGSSSTDITRYDSQNISGT